MVDSDKEQLDEFERRKIAAKAKVEALLEGIKIGLYSASQTPNSIEDDIQWANDFFLKFQDESVLMRPVWVQPMQNVFNAMLQHNLALRATNEKIVECLGDVLKTLEEKRPIIKYSKTEDLPDPLSHMIEQQQQEAPKPFQRKAPPQKQGPEEGMGHKFIPYDREREAPEEEE
jgi:hypothetical protein